MISRLGFVSQVITWLKPRLSPFYAWGSVAARGTVGRLPETVILTLKYIALDRAWVQEVYGSGGAPPEVDG